MAEFSEYQTDVAGGSFMKNLFFVLLLISTQADAANWTKVAGKWDFNGDVNRVYQVDTDSIRAKDGLVQAWVRMSTSKPSAIDGFSSKTFQSSLTLNFYDCKGGEVGGARQMLYSQPFGEGDLIQDVSRKRSEVSDGMQSPAPGTYEESVMNAVCRYKAKQ